MKVMWKICAAAVLLLPVPRAHTADDVPAEDTGQPAPKKGAKPDARTTAKSKGGGGQNITMEDGRKVRAYSFGTMDLEGKLKTPQLLYFLNRVRVELDSTTQHRRSFIKDLKKTADEKGL